MVLRWSGLFSRGDALRDLEIGVRGRTGAGVHSLVEANVVAGRKRDVVSTFDFDILTNSSVG